MGEGIIQQHLTILNVSMTVCLVNIIDGGRNLINKDAEVIQRYLSHQGEKG